MKIIDWLVEWWEEFYYKRNFKQNLIYMSSDRNIAVLYSTDSNRIKVFTHGLTYYLPIKVRNSEEDYLGALTTSFDEGLDTLSLSSLQIMLKEYESLEEYDKCIQIRDTITSKLQNNDNN
jgi:hypothetical protein